MAISLVQSLTKTQSTSTTSLQSSAFGTQPVAGNAIMVMVATNGQTPSSVQDSAGNAYVLDEVKAIPGAVAAIYRAFNIATVSPFQITVNLSVASNVTFGAVEVSGLGGGLLDQINTGTFNNDTSPSPGAVTTTVANEILIIVACLRTLQAETWTEPVGFTSRVQENGSTFIGMDGATKIDVATETITPTWTITAASNWVAVIATYAFASATGGPYAPRRGGSAPGLEIWMDSGLL